MCAALSGVQRAYWCTPFDPRAEEAAVLFAELAREARLEHIVVLSQWLASPVHPVLATRQAFAIDCLFESLAPEIGYTILNLGFFADNHLRLIGFASQLGILPSLTGDSRNAPPSNEDIARVAAAVLRDPSRHAGQSYRPTGPALLSTADMARVLTDIRRRKVRKVELPMWMFAKAARMQGALPVEISGVRHYVQDHRQGAFERGAPTNVVEQLTGQPAEDFTTIARRYAALPEAQRSPASVARAWFDFTRTPFMPGYGFNRLERQWGTPPRASTRLAMDDQQWCARHADQRPLPV
jgi:uncharacterized protein YbjT (DUF2867 family)